MIDSARFSASERSVNTLVIWNVRPMPSSVRRYSGRCVTSWPNSRTRPDDARSVPVTQWNRVVLPAPFGSDQRAPLAGGDAQRDAVDGAQPAEHLREILDLDRGGHGGSLLRLGAARAQAVDESDDAVAAPTGWWR